MKPERLFAIATTLGLGIALLLVVAACTHSSTYEQVVRYAFPSGGIAMDRSAYLHAGIAGGLYAGWSLTILLLARNERLAREPALWSAISWGLILWYLLDSSASVLTGGVYNVVGNTLFFALMLAPALALRKRATQADGIRHD